MKYLATAISIFFVMGLIGATVYAADTIELAIPLPLTGTQAKFCEIEKRSYEIAAEEINAKGGIKGKKVILTFEDSQGKPEILRAIAEKLIDVKKQPILFGEYSSSCSKAIAAFANERKTPYLVVTGADDAITKQNYRYVFRMNPPNASKLFTGGAAGCLVGLVRPSGPLLEDSSSASLNR